MSLKKPFYFRSAGHLLRKVGKLISNDPLQRKKFYSRKYQFFFKIHKLIFAWKPTALNSCNFQGVKIMHGGRDTPQLRISCKFLQQMYNVIICLKWSQSKVSFVTVNYKNHIKVITITTWLDIIKQFLWAF